MESKPPRLPDQRNYGDAYQLAFKLAVEQLIKFDNLKEHCLKSGARYQVTDAKRAIILEYLDQPYQISLPNVEISSVRNDEPVPLREKILILHYFNRAKGTPLTHNLITYKELPEGIIYFPTFSKRAIKPIVDHFGKESQQLIEIAGRLGGLKANYGDTATTISAFRYVPITWALWRGDEEFPPSGSILFDSTISDYLYTEDITVLCETITWKLVKLLREAKNP